MINCQRDTKEGHHRLLSLYKRNAKTGHEKKVNDFYHRFLRPTSSNKELVTVARILTAVTIILGSGLGLLLKSAGQAFNLLLMIGAGTGLIYILRWFNRFLYRFSCRV